MPTTGATAGALTPGQEKGYAANDAGTFTYRITVTGGSLVLTVMRDGCDVDFVRVVSEGTTVTLGPDDNMDLAYGGSPFGIPVTYVIHQI